LIANVIHTSLNYRGGAEGLAITTIEALANLGFDVELTVLEKPNIEELEDAYGNTIVSILKNTSAVHTLQTFEGSTQKYDIVINTAGDVLPYFSPSFSKINAITYCHFPLAIYRIMGEDPIYIEFLKRIRFSNNLENYNEKANLELASTTYTKMIRNSTVITNSEYSRNALHKTFHIESIVLSPPVNVDLFRNNVLLNSSNNRKNIILVISRLHPSKKVENAILLAKLLKQNKIDVTIKIVGNLYPSELCYHAFLEQMIQEYNLADNVTIQTNISFTNLVALMRECKLYFNQCPGEPFGISTVEAMSAGLIPVVPDVGGQTEFVPSKYHFHTFGEAMQIICSALDVDNSERVCLSDLVKKYSIKRYIEHLCRIVKMLLFEHEL
jgi:glycosyltransferase involved in cell wall biosynthesis